MPQKGLTRRQFVGLGGVAALGLAAGGYAANLYRHSDFDALTVTDYFLALPQWPVAMPPLTIALLTDLHVGSRPVPLEKLDAIVAQVNALQADVILLGGDYLVPRKSSALWEFIPPQPIAAKLGQLQAPYGVHAVLGNYDWSGGESVIWRDLEKMGISVLENDARLVPCNGGAFWLVGLADARKRTPDYPAAMAKATGNQPKIVLSHNPKTYRAVTNEAMLQLSGHSHGGQVRLPFIGPVVSPDADLPLKWLYGKIQEGDKPPMIVSSGIGTSSIPVKNTPFEVVRVTITAVA